MNNNYFENLRLETVLNTIPSDQYPLAFPIHWHKYVEIAVCDENASADHLPVFSINGTDYQLAPGDILFVWSGELHSVSGNSSRNVSGLQFSIGVLYMLSDMTAYINTFKALHHISMSENPQLAQTLHMYIRQIFSIQNENRSFCETEKVICLLEMFMALGRKLESDMKLQLQMDSSRLSETIQRIRDACDYICTNCDMELSLEHMAAYTGFSPSYFSKVFKQITKYNFVEYLTIQRIRLAQTLLADPQLPITEVCSKSGFKSISTFNRVFRQYKNCSPTEFRRFMVES